MALLVFHEVTKCDFCVIPSTTLLFVAQPDRVVVKNGAMWIDFFCFLCHVACSTFGTYYGTPSLNHCAKKLHWSTGMYCQWSNKLVVTYFSHHANRKPQAAEEKESVGLWQKGQASSLCCWWLLPKYLWKKGPQHQHLWHWDLSCQRLHQSLLCCQCQSLHCQCQSLYRTKRHHQLPSQFPSKFPKFGEKIWLLWWEGCCYFYARRSWNTKLKLTWWRGGGVPSLVQQ